MSRPSTGNDRGRPHGSQLQDDVTGVGVAWSLVVLVFELSRKAVRTIARGFGRIGRRARAEDGR